MIYIIFKLVVTAGLVVLISEIAARSSLVGALLASLPIVSVGAMIWMHVDGKDAAAIARLSTSIFWLVLPSLVLFVLLPLLLRHGAGFWAALVLACAATAVVYAAAVAVLPRLGVTL